MKNERSYMDSVHAYGRVWGIVVAVVLFSFPIALSVIYKTLPDTAVLLKGILATAPM